MASTPTTTRLDVGSPIVVTGKSQHAGKKGVVRHYTPQKVSVKLEDGSSPCLAPHSISSTTSSVTNALGELSVATPSSSARTPDVKKTSDVKTASGGGPRLAGLRPLKTVLTDEAESKETCFLDQLLPNRTYLLEKHLPQSKAELKLPDLSFEDNGRRYDFLTCKVFDDGANAYGGKKRCMRLLYAATSGPGFDINSDPEPLSALDLQTELEKLANWRALPSARKAAARLELLQSPAPRIHTFDHLTSSQLERIAEAQPTKDSGGCGYIPEALLASLLAGGKVPAGKVAQRAMAVQVRIVAPQLGVFKGVLVRRRGIDQIQLPPSMMKVPPSETNVRDTRVWLLFTRVFPSKASLQMGKVAAGDAACASFTQKKLSPMLARLLASRGVPPKVLQRYAGAAADAAAGNKEEEDDDEATDFGDAEEWMDVCGDDDLVDLDDALPSPQPSPPAASPAAGAAPPSAPPSVAATKQQPRHPLRSEAWLVGVAAPEEGLPAGHVFISGLKASLIPKGSDGAPCVFATRSPCVHAHDGRLVPVVTIQPEGMEDAAWASLTKRPFGELVFSNRPLHDGRGLPELIAEGDLDGDLYWVCWDADIVSHVTPRSDERVVPPVVDVSEEVAAAAAAEAHPAPSTKAEEDESESRLGDDWLKQAQAHMTDAQVLREAMAIGKLYKAGERKAKASALGLDDPDAMACFAAYRQAIDHGKHGDGISLPDHLRKELSL